MSGLVNAKLMRGDMLYVTGSTPDHA